MCHENGLSPGMNLRKAVKAAEAAGAVYADKRKSGEGRLVHPDAGRFVFNIRKKGASRALIGYVRKCMKGRPRSKG